MRSDMKRTRGGQIAGGAWVGLSMALVGSPQAAGTVEIEISGEEAATMGFPVGDIAFVDCWSVSFEHLFISVEPFELSDGTTAFRSDSRSTLVDLAAGDQLVWTFPSVPAQRWPDVSWHIARPTAETRCIGRNGSAFERNVLMSAMGLEQRASRPPSTRFDHALDRASPASPYVASNTLCPSAK